MSLLLGVVLGIVVAGGLLLMLMAAVGVACVGVAASLAGVSCAVSASAAHPESNTTNSPVAATILCMASPTIDVVDVGGAGSRRPHRRRAPAPSPR